ncbi:hypothetical protein BJX65DRAFT_269026, partial [Aspergillus insuetus]
MRGSPLDSLMLGSRPRSRNSRTMRGSWRWCLPGRASVARMVMRAPASKRAVTISACAMSVARWRPSSRSSSVKRPVAMASWVFDKSL